MQATCPDPQYRDGKQAVENANRACKLDRGNGNDFIAALAEAYAENGEFEKAREAATKALELAHDEKDQRFCRELLETFTKNRPYRCQPTQ